jgi:hypothetical protein
MTQYAARIGGDLPNTEAPSSLPRQDRRSAKAIAQFFRKQYTDGLAVRYPHARSWLKVKAIMRGIHYFRMDGGVLRPLAAPKMPRGHRAFVPVMRPLYMWHLARLNAAEVGVAGRPITGRGRDDFYASEVGQSMLTHWIEEEEIDALYKEEMNPDLLFWGRCGIYRHIDEQNQTAKVTMIPGPQLFPVPYDAPSLRAADGLMYVTGVTKEWLEMQDDLLARKMAEQGQQPPDRRMADAAGKSEHGMTAKSASLGLSPFGPEPRSDGATAISIWMKANPYRPHGEFFFMLNDELYRYWAQPQPGVLSNPMVNGKIPIELVDYAKNRDDFWARGFLEELVPMQLEANRQWTSVIRNSIQNRSFTVYDTQSIDSKDIHAEDSALVGWDTNQFDQQRLKVPVINVPGAPVNRDVAAVFEVTRQNAEKVAGYESRILYGEQSGRTEGGPATGMLNTNAQMPLQDVMDRIFRGFKRTYPAVLDLLGQVWPDQKQIRATGTSRFGQHLVVKKDDIPSSEQIVLTPAPMVAGGRNSMLQLLMQLRTIPSDDRETPIVTSRELRKALHMMGLKPPGMEIVDPAEERIQYRIGLIVNDGQQPAKNFQPATPGGVQEKEDHRMAIDLLRREILSPRAMTYGQPVQQALSRELQFHEHFMAGTVRQSNAFNDDIEEMDAAQQEQAFDHAEQDLGSLEGHIAPLGSPVA